MSEGRRWLLEHCVCVADFEAEWGEGLKLWDEEFGDCTRRVDCQAADALERDLQEAKRLLANRQQSLHNLQHRYRGTFKACEQPECVDVAVYLAKDEEGNR